MRFFNVAVNHKMSDIYKTKLNCLTGTEESGAADYLILLLSTCKGFPQKNTDIKICVQWGKKGGRIEC